MDAQPGADLPATSQGALGVEDRIGSFTSYALAADLLALREIYAGYLERVAPEAWARRTERRALGWTLLETLAHLGAVAQVFNRSVAAAAAGQPVLVPGLARRSDLRSANRAAIDAQLGSGHGALAEAFLDALAEAARLAGGLDPAALATLVDTPYYSGRSTIGEILGASLAHAGIVHGAQVAVGAQAQPIWSFFPPALMRRQITRLVHAMGLAYWPERGGKLHAALAFSVAGQGGGSWFVRVDPAGGEGRLGRVRTADVRLSFATADLFCRSITGQVRLLPNLLLRRIRVGGDLRLAARIPYLFSPT
jgi:hypothetical protein